MTRYHQTHLDSPLGPLRLLATDHGLAGVYFSDHKNVPQRVTQESPTHPVLLQTQAELREYFSGERRRFDLPLDPQGTPFQHRVWSALRDIPFGLRRSYGELARQMGAPDASRAVGRANGLNPLSIIVPCHRVVASNGKLTGYAGGLWAKEWLLEHEASVAPLSELTRP